MGRGALPVRKARLITRRDAVVFGAAGAAAWGAASMAPWAWAQADGTSVRQFSGKALHAEQGRWLYTEQHRQLYRGDRWLSGTIRYISPEGRLLAEKTLDFSQDRYIPLSRTVFHTTGQEELITQIDAEQVTMQTLRDGQRKTREVKRAPVMAADSGFHGFIQQNLEELAAGKPLQLAFGVISQHTTFRFRIRRTETRTVGSRAAVVLVAEPDSLLRMVADPLTLVYDLRTRDLLEYVGLSNLEDPQTGKAPKVRIAYEFGTPGAA